MTKIKRALISVSDKEGIVDFAKGLEKMGIEIISTGGTASILIDSGIKVKLISEITNFPEILDGRVKTLHPFIFGGILAQSNNLAHQEQISTHQISPIELVVVNLYPFQRVISQEKVELDEAVENIDIGGPSLLRAAAKNYQDVAVLIDSQDYPGILDELEKNQGELTLQTKKRLALKVFEHTANYDRIIASFLRKSFLGKEDDFPNNFYLIGEKVFDLRYGENPHQAGSFYKDLLVKEANLGNMVQLGGKELSYNNLIDLGAALEIIKDFSEPTVVFIKHTNPCGLANAITIEEAYNKAYQGDPTSAYGSIVGINKVVQEELAVIINDTPFVEAIIAPDFQDKALKILKQKKNRRIIKIGDLKRRDRSLKEIKKIPGGFLVQERDLKEIGIQDLKVVTQKEPTWEELEELLFAWKVVKHVKSNAIVLTKGKQTIGIGAGQMSRLDAIKLAILKSEKRSKGAYLASDAFFPFRDDIDEAARGGIKAIIQPGGSIRDKEVIAAANEHNLIMVFTGIRCFKH